ncbi:ABC-F family ATP-binding cassette domain-containing protein [Fulvivirgaceae bacterium BMA10]|uniref:ABC-F family ATP-binding cassette domain-containing protein n=1 Tax=Splendidivirga corallicola TaxID=3051826 RepID=A0ABT8KIU2_9BACT|nr:ABC-F family ATP-binding cassette domain-containing protein [Fulvivirgaceae bacterium BMA10]
MNYLSVESITKSFNEKVLFQNISFGIEQGQKTALVGSNGTGKSTLFKILVGSEKPDGGDIVFRNDIKVAFLNQNPTFNEELTIMEAVFDEEKPILKLIRDYEYHISIVDPNTDQQKKLQELIESMDSHNAWDYESRIKQILGKLGIDKFEQKVSSLSGGQRKRLALAKVLVEEPDFLLLDEPTNHLDIETIEWLENYLANQNMTLLLITHDRYFLERVTNHIIELEKGQLFRYQGNYGYYLEKKADREQVEAAEVEKAKNLMRKELDWIRRQPKARGTKAKYRIDAFHELKDKASTDLRKDTLTLDVQTKRQGGKILELEHISKSYGDKHLVNDFSYVFKKNDRIGIIGKNGIGKTTFLNILTKQLQPDSGKISEGVTTLFGYYTQEKVSFDDTQRVIDVVKEVAEVIKLGDGSTISASQFLHRFLFPPDMQYNPVGKLSGGEKRRLQLLRVLIKNPNFLILDEPTNDLDLQTLNILEDFLFNFKGCLMIVSHDRYFMDRLIDHAFVFQGDGVIKDFPGNYTDYRVWKLEVEKEEKIREVPEKNQEKKKEKSEDGKKKKLSFKERREYEELEKEIEMLEAEKEQMLQELNTGDLNHEELAKLGSRIEETDKMINEKSDRWLELAELAD